MQAGAARGVEPARGVLGHDRSVVMLDGTGRVVGWDAAAERLMGYAATEARGLSLETFFPPEEVAAGLPSSHLAAAAATGQCEHEGWRLRKDGTRFWGQVALTAVFDDAGQVRGFAEVTRDATVRHEAEQALQDSRQHVEALEALVRDSAIVMLDADGLIVSWNDGAHRLTGHAERDVVGNPFTVLFPAEDVAAEVPGQLLAEASSAGRAQFRGWRRRKDGSRFWGSVDVTAVFDDAGRLRAFGTVTRDAGGPPPSEAPAELRGEDLRRAVDDALTHAVVLLDPTGRVTGWNAGAEQLTGYSAEEAYDRPSDFLYLPEDVASGTAARQLAEAATAGHVEYEGWRRRKDGSRFWADTVLTAVRDEDGEVRGFGKVTRDATPRRLAEQAVHDSEEHVRLLMAGIATHAIVCWTPRGSSSAGAPGRRRSRATPPQRCSATRSPCSTQPRTWRTACRSSTSPSPS